MSCQVAHESGPWVPWVGPVSTMSRAHEYHESNPCGSLVLRLWLIWTSFAPILFCALLQQQIFNLLTLGWHASSCVLDVNFRYRSYHTLVQRCIFIFILHFFDLSVYCKNKRFGPKRTKNIFYYIHSCFACTKCLIMSVTSWQKSNKSCASRMQSQACLSFAEAPPRLSKSFQILQNRFVWFV